MNSLNLLRWYLLIALVGVALGLLVKPDPGITSLEEDASEWAPSSYSKNRFDAGVSRELAEMSWWKEVKESSFAVESGEAEKVPERKVSWSFRGVIVIGEKSYALIADKASSPLKRYLPGDSLPGGEVLEVIDKQKIRFSLPGNREGKDIERKLYAPAE